ncbi:hypothetical protein PR048_026628 [Dryococelus australis]|uniref:Uncharacterized protein n=1 Tax=Dryococelus australis TaxID=614101 RepID=A0ABQ9GLW9_9NEOP|nr:hypothetical protein PR048_026628 [Dryococelus australis]
MLPVPKRAKGKQEGECGRDGEGVGVRGASDEARGVQEISAQHHCHQRRGARCQDNSQGVCAGVGDIPDKQTHPSPSLGSLQPSQGLSGHLADAGRLALHKQCDPPHHNREGAYANNSNPAVVFNLPRSSSDAVDTAFQNYLLGFTWILANILLSNCYLSPAGVILNGFIYPQLVGDLHVVVVGLASTESLLLPDYGSDVSRRWHLRSPLLYTASHKPTSGQWGRARVQQLCICLPPPASFLTSIGLLPPHCPLSTHHEECGTHTAMALSGTILTCEYPGVARPGIEPGSPSWKVSKLTAQPPRPQVQLANPANKRNVRTLWETRALRVSIDRSFTFQPYHTAVDQHIPRENSRVQRKIAKIALYETAVACSLANETFIINAPCVPRQATTQWLALPCDTCRAPSKVRGERRKKISADLSVPSLLSFPALLHTHFASHSIGSQDLVRPNFFTHSLLAGVSAETRKFHELIPGQASPQAHLHSTYFPSGSQFVSPTLDEFQRVTNL